MTPRKPKMSSRPGGPGRLPGAIWAGIPKHLQATRRDRHRPSKATGWCGGSHVFSAFPGIEPESSGKNARATHETLQLQTPGERAQRASKGCTRPTTLAILMLAMLSPRWLRGASWCFALVLLAVLCASLLVCSVAVEACGLAPEQGYRLVLRLACFLSLPQDRARKFRKQARETHETLQLQTPGQRAQHVFAAFPGIEPESSEQKRSRNSRNVPAPNARRARAGEPQERPRRPQEAQNDSQAAPNDPQEDQNEPEEGQSELREVPGGPGRLPGAICEGFPKHFSATRCDRDAPNSNRR